MTNQPKALRVADELEAYDDYYTLDAIRLLREQHAEIERLQAENKRLRFECGALIKEQITRDACDVARGIDTVKDLQK